MLASQTRWSAEIMTMMTPIVALIAALGFAAAFFPYSPSFDRDTAAAQRRHDAQLILHQPTTTPTLGRLVFVLVDAMRHDFVAQPGGPMAFTQSLVASGQAVLVHTKAHTPTVTLPRIKALTTGTVPSFADVVFNFGLSGAESISESWLDQLVDANKTMHFFGDDTWLRLFPTHFQRTDGTTSFLVTDTVQVDNNVTRHVLEELQQPDWDVLIFHYLGLDHVGHLVGPHTDLMARKLQEMDAVVGLIWETLKANASSHPTLFVLCSDHGMTEVGNHGGSSDLETAAMALFAVPGRKSITDITYKSTDIALQWNQVDVAATVALLLGLSRPPVNSVGRAITPVLRHVNMAGDEATSVTQHLKHNALQLCRLAVLHGLTPTCDHVENLDSENELETYLSITSSQLQANSSVSSDSIRVLLVCTGAALLAALYACVWSTRDLFPRRAAGKHEQHARHVWFTAGVFVNGILWMVNPLFMISSSYVEEEQELCAFVTTTLVLALSLAHISKRILTQESNESIRKFVVHTLLLLVIIRILRAWNPAGVKWSNLPSVRSWLASSSGSWPFVEDGRWAGFACMMAFMALLATTAWISGLRGAMSACAAAVAYTRLILCHMDVFPAAMVSLAQQVAGSSLKADYALFACIAVDLVIAAIQASPGRMGRSLLITVCALHRPHNTVALVLHGAMCLLLAPKWLKSLHAPTWMAAAVFWALGQFGFFALGNTNGIATIDLVGAYAGQSTFSVAVTGPMLFLMTFSGPLLALAGLAAFLQDCSVPGAHAVARRWLTATRLAALSGYMLVMLTMRHHLFVWSVFSPKYLYMLFFAALHLLEVVVLWVAS